MDPSSSHATASLKQDDHVNISFRPFCLDLMLINQQIMGRNPPENIGPRIQSPYNSHSIFTLITSILIYYCFIKRYIYIMVL